MNRNGVNWTYAYNELSLPTSATLTLDGRTYAQSYDYSLAAALTNYTLPSGKAVAQGVDGLGRVTNVTVDSTNIASGFTYHPNGSVAGVTYGNGQVFSQTLTPRQQTDRLRSVKGAELPVDLTYTYTPRSQIAAINDQTVPNIDQAFTYDGIGRLTASTGPWGAGTFLYDGLGNIRQRSVAARTVGMSYNAANQLSAHTDTALTVPAPVSMTALYDGASRRVKQVANGVTRYSVYDASGTLIEIDEVGGAKTDYIRASGMTLARIAGSTVTWLHHDHLGSAVAGTNSAGAVVWRESEQPFGEDWTTAAANDNQAGYTGHVEDTATGLTYMQARYYDPVIGRFLSIDPVGFTPTRPDMFNRYADTANDPVNMLDPTGMDYECRPSTDPSGMQSCRSFGDVSLDAAKDIGKEAAAAGKAIAERYNRSDSSDNDYHEYDIGSEPCAGKENCDAKAVFALVEQFTPPQSLCIRQYSDCSGPGDHVLEGLGVYLTPPFNLPGPPLYAGDTNPIFTWSDQTALVSGNTTKDGHMFHFGQVIHAVYEFKGKVYIYTLGTGSGGSKKLNEAVGPSLIRPTHKQTADALR